MPRHVGRHSPCLALTLLLFVSAAIPTRGEEVAQDASITRVFIFAGQSNMVGSDSKVDDIKRYCRLGQTLYFL